jgi:hypothetical protein
MPSMHVCKKVFELGSLVTLLLPPPGAFPTREPVPSRFLKCSEMAKLDDTVCLLCAGSNELELEASIRVSN